MKRSRQDRATNKIRTEAGRLALEGVLTSAAEIEAHMIGTGLAGVPEALEGMGPVLDGLCRAAKQPRGFGIEAMFLESE